MNKSKKMITTVIGLLLAVGFIVLIACNIGHSEVFKLQPGEAESLGVVFPEDGSPYENYYQLFKQYQNKGEYEKTVVVAKKMIEISPKTEGGYLDLMTSYEKLEMYDKALVVNKKLIRMVPPDPNDESVSCGYVMNYASILERSGKQDEAIKFLEKYRKKCPQVAAMLISGLEEAKSKGEQYFPIPD